MEICANENWLFGWVWLYMLVIPPLKRLRQERDDFEFG